MIVLGASFQLSARADEGPLLVVVEAPPALDADAAEIRRAIGTELHAPAYAPMKTTGEPAARALIVALDRDRIAMSLRSGAGAPIGRVIAAPSEHAARLRAIAWLAGNLARDQVTPIVAETPVDMPSLVTISKANPTFPATEPPPIAGLAPSPATPRLTSDLPTIWTQAENPRGSAAHFWTLGAADGPTTNFPICKPSRIGPGWGRWPAPCAPLSRFGTAWRLEGQRRSGSERFFQGAAVEGTAGNDFSPQLIGSSVFVGSSRGHGKWTFESTVGAGLELSYVFTSTVGATVSSTQGLTSSVTTSQSLRPALYADAAIALAHPISESLDAVLRVGGHMSTDALSNWFLSITLGLRYNLL